MYNNLVGGFMKKILFKIKKYFLILISFIVNFLFNRNSELNSNSKKDKLEFGDKKGATKGHYQNDKYGSKDNHIKSKYIENEKKYPTIRVNIEKIYSIEKRIDKIILQIEKEEDIEVLNELFEELQKYKNKMEYLETKIVEERTNKDEYKQFIDISKSIQNKVKESVDFIEKKVDKLQILRGNQDLLQKEQERINKNQEEKIDKENKRIKDDNLVDKKDNLHKLDNIIIIKEVCEDSIRIEKSKSNLVEDNNKIEEKKVTKKDKDIEPVVKKDVDTKKKTKQKEEEKDKTDLSKTNIDIGTYKLQVESIKSIVKNININKQKENIKKITSNTLGALVLMKSITPLVMMNNKGIKDILILNNLVRKSRNIVGKKKLNKLTYEEVISRVLSSNIKTHINFILTDTMSQINSLKEELKGYGDNEEIQQLLAQLDEIELELLEKMSQVNENTVDYSQESKRTR